MIVDRKERVVSTLPQDLYSLLLHKRVIVY